MAHAEAAHDAAQEICEGWLVLLADDEGVTETIEDIASTEELVPDDPRTTSNDELYRQYEAFDLLCRRLALSLLILELCEELTQCQMNPARVPLNNHRENLERALTATPSSSPSD